MGLHIARSGHKDTLLKIIVENQQNLHRQRIFPSNIQTTGQCLNFASNGTG
jgi:hypothetical protein